MSLKFTGDSTAAYCLLLPTAIFAEILYKPDL